MQMTSLASHTLRRVWLTRLANDRVFRKIKERAPFSIVEESLQQTSVACSGSSHNALHSLVLYVRAVIKQLRSEKIGARTVLYC